jgi:hypothetical protein
MRKNMMDVIKDASSKTFYEMEKHSQLVIDMIEGVESSDLEDSEVRGSLVYDIDNILEIIDPKRVDDIKVLTEVKLALRKN